MRRRTQRLGRVIALCCMACVTAGARADDWPQFRGPNASGVSNEKKPLPVAFSASEGLRWAVRLGDGIGSPIVVGDRAFATAMTGDTRFGVFAFDAGTGKPLWKNEFETGKLPRITPPNSHASSTPACSWRRSGRS